MVFLKLFGQAELSLKMCLEDVPKFLSGNASCKAQLLDSLHFNVHRLF
jgi:hypothetical protein